MYEQGGIYCFDLWLQRGDNCKDDHGEDLGAVGGAGPPAGNEAVSPTEEDTFVDGADEGAEQRAPKRLRSPKSPTQEEIDEHEVTDHTTYRTWCGHCVRARGLRERHVKVSEDEKAQRAFPMISLDYFWKGANDREREHELPSLQVKDEHSGMTWACVVPAKGPDRFAVDYVLGILDECGYKRIILKSDNEPAIKSLKTKVKEVAKVEIVLEEGKTGDKPSTGAVEVSVRESKRQCEERCRRVLALRSRTSARSSHGWRGVGIS